MRSASGYHARATSPSVHFSAVSFASDMRDITKEAGSCHRLFFFSHSLSQNAQLFCEAPHSQL